MISFGKFLGLLLDISLIWMYAVGQDLKRSKTDLQGPRFVVEPPDEEIFLNNTGTVIRCNAIGHPMPEVTWILRDGRPVSSVANVMKVQRDGSLIFLPFRANEYLKEIHDTVYKCEAKNSVGIVGSRDVRVKGVLQNPYVIRVYDQKVIKGTTAVLPCYVPSHVSEYVYVTSWIIDDNVTVSSQNTISQKKYIIFPDGTLHINHVTVEDGYQMFRCLTKNRLTGNSKGSDNTARLIVLEPSEEMSPTITDSRPKITVKVGESVLIPCAGQGHPPPKRTWYRMKGSEWMLATSWPRTRQVEGTLWLEDAQIEDEGHYRCMINNTLGKKVVQTTLTVIAPLKVHIEPHFLVMLSGGTATLTCVVSGHPVDSTVWMKNFQTIKPDGRTYFRSRKVLHIKAVTRSDQGMYQCFVYSNGNSVQATAQLVVNDVPPELHQGFPERTLEAGTSLSLHCIFSGHPLPVVMWLIDKIPLSDIPQFRIGKEETVDGRLKAFLNISRIRTRDGGFYECVANNGVSSVSHVARINVYGPPYVRPMKNVSVIEGETLILQCPVAGYPIKYITWERDGFQLPINHRQQVFSNGSIIVREVARDSDQGTYTCIAISEDGDRDHEDVTIKVTTPPKIIPFDFPNRVREGTGVVITCGVNDGDPPFLIKLSKDGRPLSPESGVTLQVHERFVLLAMSSVKAHHAGNYTCTISNSGGSSSHSSYLNIDVPPRWVVEPSNSSVIQGQSVNIDSVVQGYPSPRITWMKASDGTTKNFVPLYNSQHYVIFDNGTLIIRDVAKENEGFYLCQASNNVGPDLRKLFTLTVHVPPGVHVQHQVHTAVLDDTLEIHCEANGELPIKIKWFKDNHDVSSSSDGRYVFEERTKHSMVESVLYISKVIKNDTGLFFCLASNEYGNSTGKYQIIVQEVPTPPFDLRIKSKTGRSLTVTWKKPFDGHSAITQYSVQYSSEKSATWQEMSAPPSQTSVVIQGLIPATVYNLRIFAENAIGRSNYSAVYKVETEEEAPGGPPLEVQAVATGPNSIKVSWKPPEEKLWNGRIKGYYIGYRIVSSSETSMYKTVEIKGNTELESHVTNLKRSTKYAVSVQAFNGKGPGPMSESVFVVTLADVPPTSPVLSLLSSTSQSLIISWNDKKRFGSPVTEYILYQKEEHGNWLKVSLRSQETTYTAKGLKCGSKYQFYVVSLNSVGRSEPSEIFTGRTDGAAPLSPSKNDFIFADTTTAKLNFLSWQSGGCPIESFSIKLRRKPLSHWTAIRERVSASQSQYTIQELFPGTWYDIQVTAYNSAGATEAQYEFQTLNTTFLEEPVQEILTISPRYQETDLSLPLFLDVTIIVPVATSVVIIIIIIVVGCVLYNKRDFHHSTSSEGSRNLQVKSRQVAETMVLKEIKAPPNHGCLSTGISSDEGTQRSSSSSQSHPVSSMMASIGVLLPGDDEGHPYATPYDTIHEYRLEEPGTSGIRTLNRGCRDKREDNFYISRQQCRPDRSYEALKPSVFPLPLSRATSGKGIPLYCTNI
ncbi:cell adhesion molecule Dscam1-like isoform X3 [Tachypleus tridentatus]|uniref:cell adhesion molecule Dscam1-like isoform X3 n=1 Tax=Tachypleus tridentatus TaxID=6853 RepID=UPI003FCFDF09